MIIVNIFSQPIYVTWKFPLFISRHKKYVVV